MMRGGSRYGAGRPAYKAQIGSLLCLNIQEFIRRGLLVSGSSFGWHWSIGDEPAGSITVRVDSDSQITLSYAQTIEGERKCVSYPIRIDRTECNFGGSRRWFVCPKSGQRVLKLYFRGGGWYARQCVRVGYACQSEDMMGRMWRKKRKIESRLLGEELEKPKGMHWTTYNRLMDRWWDAEGQMNADLFARLGQFMKAR